MAPPEDASLVLKPSESPKPENAITIVVSSRVLFNMEKEQQIYELQGMEEYIKYQVEHETQPFSPGPAFSFVKALEAVNTQLRVLYPKSEELFNVVLMTNNHEYPRLSKTIDHYQLFKSFSKTKENSPTDYLKDHHTCNLYLSADPVKVCEALDKGIAAATMFTPETITEVSETQLHVAFDGDAVLFSDESERIFKTKGMDEFLANERAHVDKPLDHGPFKGFLEALEKLQKKFYAKVQRKKCPIRTYLVTTRGGDNSGYRALNTLRSWGLEMDEALLLGGAPKGPTLKRIKPHIFFDDKEPTVKEAANVGIVACHVPFGVSRGDTNRS